MSVLFTVMEKFNKNILQECAECDRIGIKSTQIEER